VAGGFDFLDPEAVLNAMKMSKERIQRGQEVA
jgi:hypothetical protein